MLAQLSNYAHIRRGHSSSRVTAATSSIGPYAKPVPRQYPWQGAYLGGGKPCCPSPVVGPQRPSLFPVLSFPCSFTYAGSLTSPFVSGPVTGPPPLPTFSPVVGTGPILHPPCPRRIAPAPFPPGIPSYVDDYAPTPFFPGTQAGLPTGGQMFCSDVRLGPGIIPIRSPSPGCAGGGSYYYFYFYFFIYFILFYFVYIYIFLFPFSGHLSCPALGPGLYLSFTCSL